MNGPRNATCGGSRKSPAKAKPARKRKAAGKPCGPVTQEQLVDMWKLVGVDLNEVEWDEDDLEP